MENLLAVREKEGGAKKLADPVAMELVADKGYHSNEVLTDMAALGIRTYISEPDRGRRNWKGKPAELRGPTPRPRFVADALACVPKPTFTTGC